MVTDTLDVNSTQFMQNSGKIIVKKILPCYQRGKERSEMAKYLEHQTYDNLGLSFQILFFFVQKFMSIYCIKTLL